MSSMQIGQNVGGLGKNVGRWDVPSADGPSADWTKCHQIGRYSQMGWNIHILTMAWIVKEFHKAGKSKPTP